MRYAVLIGSIDIHQKPPVRPSMHHLDRHDEETERWVHHLEEVRRQTQKRVSLKRHPLACWTRHASDVVLVSKLDRKCQSELRTGVQAHVHEAEVDTKADVRTIVAEERYPDATWDAYCDRTKFKERSGRRHVKDEVACLASMLLADIESEHGRESGRKTCRTAGYIDDRSIVLVDCDDQVWCYEGVQKA